MTLPRTLRRAGVDPPAGGASAWDRRRSRWLKSHRIGASARPRGYSDGRLASKTIGSSASRPTARGESRQANWAGTRATRWAGLPIWGQAHTWGGCLSGLADMMDMVWCGVVWCALGQDHLEGLRLKTPAAADQAGDLRGTWQASVTRRRPGERGLFPYRARHAVTRHATTARRARTVSVPLLVALLRGLRFLPLPRHRL